MKEELIIKEVTNSYKRRISHCVNNSIEVNMDEMVDGALKEFLRHSLTVPEEGYYGQIGVMKEVPITKGDLDLFRPKVRAVLNEALLKYQSDKLIKTIGTTSAMSLIKGVFEAEEEKYFWVYTQYSDKIIVRVEITKIHYITIAVHLSSNMLSDVDRIMPAVKQAKEMIEKYGADFRLNRVY